MPVGYNNSFLLVYLDWKIIFCLVGWLFGFGFAFGFALVYLERNIGWFVLTWHLILAQIR